jgi:EpsI family protein
MTSRIYFSALALLGIFGTAELLKGRGMPTELADPKLRIQALPRQVGQWTAEDDRKPDPEIFKAIGAKDVIDRIYREKRGNSVALHSAVFLTYGIKGLPHPPELCYPGAGFRINESKPVFLESTDKSVHRAQLITFERDGQLTYCLYWYQIGGVTFCDDSDQRQLVLSFRGRTTWPPMVKIMLQTNGGSAEEAERRMKELAEPLLTWTSAFR